MNPRLRRPLIVIGLVTIVAIAVFVVPLGLSLYYQIRGGQRIEYVLRFEEGLDALDCEPLQPDGEGSRTEVEYGKADLEQSISLNKNNSQAYYYLGKAHCLLGDAENAVEDYLQYTELKPANPLGYISLGFAYEEVGTPDKAAKAWKDGDVVIEDFLIAGRQSLQENNFDEASKWYERASVFSPSDGKVIYETGLFYEQLEDWQSALNTYDIAINQKSLNIKGISSLLYRIGRIYSEHMSSPDLKKSKTSFKNAISRNDYFNDWERADSYYRLGVILRNEGNNPREFVAYFKKAQDIYPNHVFAHILLGVTYYAIDSDDKRAEEAILFGLDLDPQNKWGYFHLGEIYRKEGKIEESIIAFNKALEVDPGFERAKRSLQAVLSESQ